MQHLSEIARAHRRRVMTPPGARQPGARGRRAVAVDGPLPYRYQLPTLPVGLDGRTDAMYRHFWLTSWMIDQAVAESMEPIYLANMIAADAALQVAFVVSRAHLHSEANKSLHHLMGFGGLLYAWAGTTYLEHAGATGAPA